MTTAPVYEIYRYPYRQRGFPVKGQPLGTKRRQDITMRLAAISIVFLLSPLRVDASQSRSAQDSSVYETAIAKSRVFVQDTIRILGSPGASLCVAKHDRILWSEAFGLADVEEQVPATTLTRFRIGSVSKALTSVGLARLVQEGRLDLDAPVQHYVPSFPLKPWPITSRELAGHLAGIRSYAPGEFESQKHYATVLDGISIFSADSLLLKPGTAFLYSSYGWNLLGAVIEGASGQPFTRFMKTRVLEPAGMTNTEPDFVDSIVPLRARSYLHPDSSARVINSPYVDNSYKWASGGYLSTAEDLCRLGEVLLAGQLVRPDIVRLLWTSQETTDGTATGYGMGWYVVHDKAGRLVVFHPGDAKGSSALLAIYPTSDLILAVLLNSDRSFIEQAGRIADWFLTP